MTVIYPHLKKNIDWKHITQEELDSMPHDVSMANICQVKTCSHCGNDVWNDNFIWYCGGSDIVLCCNCAESVITGMSRDLLEIKGHSEYKGKPADNVNPLYLKQENERLIKRCLVYIKQIVDLQELLARQR